MSLSQALNQFAQNLGRYHSVFHLRPHASKGKDNGSAKDRSILPNGEVITKQCFWLDRRYIARIIASNL